MIVKSESAFRACEVEMCEILAKTPSGIIHTAVTECTHVTGTSSLFAAIDDTFVVTMIV